ncbi:unnamed protein product [Mytilus edulis]|uniref:Uncharacterized protein n=1 Tax=Mytilus edulis TaxID=6550 RepID=A0A8S3QT76_MYTED|nr:unnamed protein product [Mytilus edulis]
MDTINSNHHEHSGIKQTMKTDKDDEVSDESIEQKEISPGREENYDHMHYGSKNNGGSEAQQDSPPVNIHFDDPQAMGQSDTGLSMLRVANEDIPNRSQKVLQPEHAEGTSDVKVLSEEPSDYINLDLDLPKHLNFPHSLQHISTSNSDESKEHVERNLKTLPDDTSSSQEHDEVACTTELEVSAGGESSNQIQLFDMRQLNMLQIRLVVEEYFINERHETEYCSYKSHEFLMCVNYNNSKQNPLSDSIDSLVKEFPGHMDLMNSDKPTSDLKNMLYTFLTGYSYGSSQNFSIEKLHAKNGYLIKSYKFLFEQLHVQQWSYFDANPVVRVDPEYPIPTQVNNNVDPQGLITNYFEEDDQENNGLMLHNQVEAVHNTGNTDGRNRPVSQWQAVARGNRWNLSTTVQTTVIREQDVFLLQEVARGNRRILPTSVRTTVIGEQEVYLQQEVALGNGRNLPTSVHTTGTSIREQDVFLMQEVARGNRRNLPTSFQTIVIREQDVFLWQEVARSNTCNMRNLLGLPVERFSNNSLATMLQMNSVCNRYMYFRLERCSLNNTVFNNRPAVSTVSNAMVSDPIRMDGQPMAAHNLANIIQQHCQHHGSALPSTPRAGPHRPDVCSSDTVMTVLSLAAIQNPANLHHLTRDLTGVQVLEIAWNFLQCNFDVVTIDIQQMVQNRYRPNGDTQREADVVSAIIGDTKINEVTKCTNQECQTIRRRMIECPLTIFNQADITATYIARYLNNHVKGKDEPCTSSHCARSAAGTRQTRRMINTRLLIYINAYQGRIQKTNIRDMLRQFRVGNSEYQVHALSFWQDNHFTARINIRNQWWTYDNKIGLHNQGVEVDDGSPGLLSGIYIKKVA